MTAESDQARPEVHPIQAAVDHWIATAGGIDTALEEHLLASRALMALIASVPDEGADVRRRLFANLQAAYVAAAANVQAIIDKGVR